jgi:hypothetical protein
MQCFLSSRSLVRIQQGALTGARQDLGFSLSWPSFLLAVSFCETAQNPSGFVRVGYFFNRFPTEGEMGQKRLGWLADLSVAFKRHRQGRSGWFIELKNEACY